MAFNDQPTKMGGARTAVFYILLWICRIQNGHTVLNTDGGVADQKKTYAKEAVLRV